MEKLDFTVRDELIEYILTNMDLAKLSPSGRELTCRCPICGDSESNRRKTSFSINVDDQSERFLFFQCFRASCGAKGIVNEDFLDEIGFTNRSSINKIISFNAKRTSKIGGKYRAKTVKELTNVIEVKDNLSDTKLRYINNRLGLNLTFNDLLRFKINLNLNRLLSLNEIYVSPSRMNYYDKLSTYGVSFISAYNDYVIVRDISKNQVTGKRYNNINVFNNYDDVTKCYCIPAKLDLLSPEPTVINISEGAFDILGVYHHLDIDRDYKNQIFIAACGSGIVRTIQSYIRQYGLLDVKINIFSDADVPLEKYYELNKLRNYVTKFDVTVYYNILSKDFGVPKDKIKYTKTRL